MKRLSEITNIVPVIAKSDCLTVDERVAFKKRIKEELKFHDIRIYPLVEETQEGEALSNYEMIDKQLSLQFLVFNTIVC